MKVICKINKFRYQTIVFCLLGLFPFSDLRAQFYSGSSQTFGKNRVQWDDQRLWFYLNFEKFDTYFYLNGRNLAEYTAITANRHIANLERKLDFTLNEKIRFILFNSLSDLKESNIGLDNNEEYNIGGITHIVGNKIFLYYNGSHADLEKQIRAGVAEIILNQMLYGSAISSQVKNTTLLTMPEWYQKGLISFLSEEWNTDVDSRVSDGILSGRFRKFNRLTGEDAIYCGHSIWKYIADKYGFDVIPNIIYMSKASRSVESGFLFILGISFKTLIADWQNYYTQQYTDDRAQRENPTGISVAKRLHVEKVYLNPRFSPDGRYLAYVSNQLGRTRLWLKESASGKKKCIVKSGFKLSDKTEYGYPVMAWHPTGRFLSYFTIKRGVLHLWFYYPDSGKKEKRKLFGFENVLDYSYNTHGNAFVMSAVLNGRTDIFVCNLISNTYESITKDVFDDYNPRFLQNSRYIVFASNRINDTLKPDIETLKRKTIEKLPAQSTTDLFLYDYRTKNPVLRRLTQTPLASEIQPLEAGNAQIIYLSDENGIRNRYLAVLDSNISYVDTITHYSYTISSKPLTNYQQNIIQHDIATEENLYAEVVFKNGYYQLFEAQVPSNQTLENKLPLTVYMEKLKKQSETAVPDTIPIKALPQKQTRKKRLSTIIVESEDQDTTKINIDNYAFGNNGQKEKTKISYITGKDIIEVPKQLNYDVEFSISKLVNQMNFSYLNTSYQQFTGGGAPIYLNPGFNGLFMVGANDLLEDYRIVGGLRLSPSFDDNEYMLSYENLKKRVDKQVTFIKKRIDDFQEYSIVRTHTHEIHYLLKYPFNNVLALKGSMLLRNDKSDYLSTDKYNLKKPYTMRNWLGIKSELIFDNTRDAGLNLYFGSRCKIFAEWYQMIHKQNKQLIVVGMDLRQYQKIHRTVIWANRLAASSSFGNHRLIYYMGGVDNWLFPKFNSDINIATDKNYTYQTLATPMRGFIQNIRNGNSFALFNSELRFPVFRYFLSKPLKSEFVKNFLIIGFFDAGTAWTGSTPWSDENSLYTHILEQGPIKVIIKTQREPMVGGYGFGVRSKLLGYYVRADWAWGIEERKVNKSIFYLSLNLDF